MTTVFYTVNQDGESNRKLRGTYSVFSHYRSALIRNLIMLKGTATLTAQDEWIDHVIPGIDKGHHCTKIY